MGTPVHLDGEGVLVLLVLVTGSVIVGVVAGLAVRSWPAADPAADISGSLGRQLQQRRHLRFLRARFDPATATGLALTVASTCVVVGGVVAGLLFSVVRSRGVLGVDTAVANWAAAHATSLSTTLLRALTWVGSTTVAVGMAVVVGALEWRRIRSRSMWLFLSLVVVGQLVIANLIKLGVQRARPTIDPLASFSGSSFPSGHSVAAASCYAAIALVMSRGRTPRTRAALAGLAAGIAAAVGMSRMLLGVHWFTDVIAGLAVGWAWFALCAIATGGRLLRFGTTVETPMPVDGRANRLLARRG
jgi:undecaprenyl-diphosphatase